MTTTPTIIWTHTDEAPALATYSFLPIIQAFAGPAGIAVETSDISLAGRIIARFPDHLQTDQRIDDGLTHLGEMTGDPGANIVKLPNISASIPQLKAAIAELQSHGYDVPHYPQEPATADEYQIREIYDSIKGSAVNPVLRQGNSDRRAPLAVKEYAKAHPHPMGEWSSDSKTHVATMTSGDFRDNEVSITVEAPTTIAIHHVGADGVVTVLRDGIDLLAGEVLDGTFMSKAALVTFLAEQIDDAKEKGVLFSLHLKATMMKVSDPIIFGHGVRTYFKELFDQHGPALDRIGVDAGNGMGDLLSRVDGLEGEERSAIEASIAAAYQTGPSLAMVDSDRGITNLHVPSDVIIDASMPAMIRTSGCMWNAEGKMQDTKAVIPDSSYADVYQVVIQDCQKNGAYDPTTMGSVPNVGLMAQKAEEYGSHDKTFEIEAPGMVQIVDQGGTVLLSHEVEEGDIWRACQTKDAPIQDWVKLAVSRARETGSPAVFWLDESRAHDAQLIAKVEVILQEHDTEGLEFHILAPAEATAFSLERIRRGEDTISVTGNVLRDYLTDLFPILEVGTSAKMLSIVPLMGGGGLFETGAGGSAPKHVQQFMKENHLRWDSLGEFMALVASLDHLSHQCDHPQARILALALDKATERYLMENRTPSRKGGEHDNRGSHFYVAMYWAQAMVEQLDDAKLAAVFAQMAQALEDHTETIVREFLEAQGPPQDIGGYYQPDSVLAEAAMRPSETFNGILANLTAKA
jgi:isocitrate dehydrogenase